MTTSPFFQRQGTADQQREATRRGDRVVTTPAPALTDTALQVAQETHPQETNAVVTFGPMTQHAAPTGAMATIQEAPAPQPPPPPPPPQPQPQPQVQTQAQATARRQRVRIDPTVKHTTEKPLSPLREAEEVIIRHTASLRDGLASLLRLRGKEYLALAHRAENKTRQIFRLRLDDDYIPILARVTFKLQAMKEVEELHGFKELQELVDEDMSTVQNRLKERITECAVLEQEYLHDKMHSILVHTIKDTVSMFGTAHSISAKEYGKIGCAVIQEHGIALTKHLEIDSGALLALFRAEMNISADEEIELEADHALILPQIKHILEFVFVRSWDSYLDALKQQEIDISLAKKAKEALTKDATEATAMEVDKEISVDPTQLKELIAKQAKAELSRMLREGKLPEVQNRKQQTKKSGNEQRGKKPSASQKKKKGQEKKPPADQDQGKRNNGSQGGKKKPAPASSKRSSKETKNGRRNANRRS